jgi:hypothetical protein
MPIDFSNYFPAEFLKSYEMLSREKEGPGKVRRQSGPIDGFLKALQTEVTA